MSYFDKLEGIKQSLLNKAESFQDTQDTLEQGAENILLSKVNDLAEKLEAVGGLGIASFEAWKNTQKLIDKLKNMKGKDNIGKDEVNEEGQDIGAGDVGEGDIPTQTTAQDINEAAQNINENIGNVNNDVLDMVGEYANALSGNISDATRSYLSQSQQESQVPDPEVNVSDLPSEVEMTTFTSDMPDLSLPESLKLSSEPQMTSQQQIMEMDPEAGFENLTSNVQSLLSQPSEVTGALRGDSTLARVMGQGQEAVEGMSSNVSEQVAQAGNQISDTIANAQDVAQGMASNVGDVVDGVAEGAANVASTAVDTASAVGSSLLDTGLAIGDAVLDAVPVVGEVAMVATAVAGFFESMFGHSHNDTPPPLAIVNKAGFDPSSLVKESPVSLQV